MLLVDAAARHVMLTPSWLCRVCPLQAGPMIPLGHCRACLAPGNHLTMNKPAHLSVPGTANTALGCVQRTQCVLCPHILPQVERLKPIYLAHRRAQGDYTDPFERARRQEQLQQQHQQQQRPAGAGAAQQHAAPPAAAAAGAMPALPAPPRGAVVVGQHCALGTSPLMNNARPRFIELPQHAFVIRLHPAMSAHAVCE